VSVFNLGVCLLLFKFQEVDRKRSIIQAHVGWDFCFSRPSSSILKPLKLLVETKTQRHKTLGLFDIEQVGDSTSGLTLTIPLIPLIAGPILNHLLDPTLISISIVVFVSGQWRVP